VRGGGFFWAVELIKDERNTRFGKSERDRLLRGYLPRKLREVGMIARLDDRGDSVFHIAPPLISDRAVLDEIVDLMADVLTGAGAYMGLSRAA
jgi:4-aminobutyrate aminotransferase-like enzyme